MKEGREPRILAVAFDLDGLMFDTESLFFRIAGQMLQERGKTFTQEIMNAMIGRPWPIAGLAFKTMAGLEESLDELRAETRARFQAEMDTAVHPTPGLISLLAKLRALGLPLAVATSSRREYAERLIRSHGLIDLFQFVLGAEDVCRSKPDPEIYLTAAARFGVPPSNMLVLEDSPAGISAAKAAKAYCVAVPHDQSPAANLAEADLIVPRLDDPRLFNLLDVTRPSALALSAE